MEPRLTGIHHVTAISGDPQVNVTFYTDVLGLRMIKKTVNFDDPQTYHLYYGDDLGRPGTIMTFFPFVGIGHGTSGVGQVTATAFAIPAASLDYWTQRLTEFGITYGDPQPRFGQQVISLYDPSGLLLELVTVPDEEAGSGWQGSTVPAEHTIRAFHSATMLVVNQAPSAQLLTEVLGFQLVGNEGNRSRFALESGQHSMLVDVVERTDAPYGRMGAGTVHHIAWRVSSDEEQLAWQRVLRQHGVDVTEVRDRQYFRSIYFHEPGRVLFEIATDAPGFAVDEAPETLGTALKLPPWLEGRREHLERTLPPISPATPA